MNANEGLSSEQASLQINHLARDHYLTSADISAFFKEGLRFSNKTVAMIGECRDVMVKMPEGKKGIVVGVGENSKKWQKKDGRRMIY